MRRPAATSDPVLDRRDPGLPGGRVARLRRAGAGRPDARRRLPAPAAELRGLGGAYWWIVAPAGVFTLARFSEAFLILRARDVGLSIALAPL